MNNKLGSEFLKPFDNYERPIAFGMTKRHLVMALGIGIGQKDYEVGNEFYDKFVPELHQKNMKIQMIGETDRLPKQTFDALKKAEELTKLNTGLILNFALNYGGRAEITQAVKLIAQDVLDAKINPGDITEELIGEYLFTGHLPKVLRDPDLIIRTSGELRLSNFLPWQAAYSELYFTDVLWPDFDEEALKEAIVEYNRRNRRFGGV